MSGRIALFLLLFLPLLAQSQILPKEGSKLNYRLVGFSFPKDPKTTKYKVIIATGKHTDTGTFNKNIIATIATADTKLMIELPSFGTDYTWRVVHGSNKGKEIVLNHFNVAMNDRVDTSKLRLRILQPASGKTYNDLIVSLDGGGVFYDIKGTPLAYLPEVNNLGGYVIGMGFTNNNSITFNFLQKAYEINLNGDILWEAPVQSGVAESNIPEMYHHEIVKLANGNYMVMGMEFVTQKIVSNPDTTYLTLSKNLTETYPYKPAKYGTLIEFDKQGKVVWSWRDTKNLVGTDFDYFKSPVDTNFIFDPHSNSFFFDEAKKVVYMSYRNINRVTKIDYPSGKVLNVYGERFKPGMPSLGLGLFCNPHGIKRSADGFMYFYNNNSCFNTDSLPSVVMFKEPEKDGDSLKKVWEYICKVEAGYSKKFGSGGSVMELADKTLFVCMGNEYSKVFIINMDKKELWSALPERHIETDNIWLGNRQYRANVITRHNLEQLIWAAEDAIHIK